MREIAARKIFRCSDMIIAIVLLLLAATIGACAKKKLTPFDTGLATKVNWQEETPQSVLRRLQQSQNKIKYITGYFTLSLDPAPQGHFSSLNGVLYLNRAKREPIVRITALAAFGRVLFDMVQKEDQVEIYVPAKKTLYRGEKHHMREGDSPFGDIFESLLIDLSQVKPKKNGSLVFQQADVVVPLTEGELLIDKMTGLIMSFRNSRQEIFYKGYQRAAGHPPIPIVIELNNFAEKRKARCTLSDLNFENNETSITLEGYQPQYFKKLSELDKNRGS